MIQFFLQARLFFSHSLCKPKNQPPAFLNLLNTTTTLFNSKFVSAQKNLPCQCLTVPAASKSTQRWRLKTTCVLYFWRSEIWEHAAGLPSPGGSRRESVSLSFSDSTRHRHSQARGPFLHLRSSPVASSLLSDLCSVLTSSFSNLHSPTAFLKGSLWLFWAYSNNSRKSLHVKILDLVTSVKSLFPCKLPYLQVPWLRVGTSLGAGFIWPTTVFPLCSY